MQIFKQISKLKKSKRINKKSCKIFRGLENDPFKKKIKDKFKRK